jgi:hypothetical protein
MLAVLDILLELGCVGFLDFVGFFAVLDNFY